MLPFPPRNRHFRLVPGTCPTNSTSLFQIVRIEQVAGVATQMEVSFEPAFADRTYQVLAVGTLTSGAWPALGSYEEISNGTERTVRALNVTNAPMFYRVHVTYSP